MQVRRQWSHIFKILGAGVRGECQLNILGLAGSEIPLPHQEAADSPAWEIPSHPLGFLSFSSYVPHPPHLLWSLFLSGWHYFKNVL